MIRWQFRLIPSRWLQRADSWLHLNAGGPERSSRGRWWQVICDAYDRRCGWPG